MRKTTHQVRFEPDGVELKVADGTPLARAAADAGLPIEVPCGGLGQCGKCRVEVIRGRAEPDPDEQRWLTPIELRDGLRLACRQQVTTDLTVVLGEEVRSRANQILVGSQTRQTRVDSGVRRPMVPLGKAPLGDERDDWTRLETEVGERLVPDLAALAQLPDALRLGRGQVTATVVGDRCIRLDPGADPASPVGFAVDIGTTTIVCYLLDLATGAELANAAMLNPQVSFGEDVIARIHYADAEKHGLRILSRAVRKAIEDLLREACTKAAVDLCRVARGTIVGNATMTHLLLGISPRGLGIAPFAPVTHEAVTAPGRDLGLRVASDAPVTVLPNIAGFLGSDTVGVVLAVMADPRETCLAVDIGTNGEVVLFHDGRYYGCSAAAGPAFEGARIGCGMRGAAGAISRVEAVDGDVRLAVIENQPPRGLCGSGLMDAVAVLLELKLLDPMGRLAADGAVPPQFTGRLHGEGNARSFELAARETSATGEALVLTGKDIREVQLAKSSIRASIEATLASAGTTIDDVATLYLAGGFGSYLQVASALRVGLLPPINPDRVVAVGNAAGAGARLALISTAELAAAERLAREVEVLYLAHHPVYQMQFMEQMVFPAS